jgi:hypothetical protein
MKVEVFHVFRVDGGGEEKGGGGEGISNAKIQHNCDVDQVRSLKTSLEKGQIGFLL